MNKYSRPRQDHPDDRAARLPGVRARQLGPPSGGGADERDAQLGAGVQAVVSGLQGHDLLWRRQGEAAQETGRWGRGVWQRFLSDE